MENRVHLRRAEALSAVEEGAERLGLRAAAFKTRAMAGRESGDFIKEEQFGVAAAPHLALAALEGADADDPLLGSPAATSQVRSSR
jgi:hypothetical protein